VNVVMKMGERLDKKVAVYTLALLFLGAVLAFLASSWSLSQAEQAPWDQAWGHVEKVLLALGLCALCCAIPYRRVGQFALFGVWVSILGLVLLLFDLPFVIKSGDIPRWIDLGFFVVQPSEIAKLCIVLSLPVLIDRDPVGLRRRPRQLFRLLLPFGIVAALLAAQPNFGSILAIGLCVAGILWVAKLPMQWFLLGGVLLGALTWFGFTHVSKLESRLDNWWTLLLTEQVADPTGYQSRQALVGLGNGGWAGAAAGEGVTRYNFLPENDSDYVFAVLGEQWGFVGTCVVVAMFAFLVFRALRIARETSDGLAYLMAVAIALMIGSFALLNLAMVTSVVPVIGLPLPFLSAGGSAMLTNLAAIGVLLNISATARRARSGSRWGN
jgi:cell division protein FtsW (lipid II flippase)